VYSKDGPSRVAVDERDSGFYCFLPTPNWSPTRASRPAVKIASTIFSLLPPDSTESLMGLAHAVVAQA
jgi:hypothetical protein